MPGSVSPCEYRAGGGGCGGGGAISVFVRLTDLTRRVHTPLDPPAASRRVVGLSGNIRRRRFDTTRYTSMLDSVPEGFLNSRTMLRFLPE